MLLMSTKGWRMVGWWDARLLPHLSRKAFFGVSMSACATAPLCRFLQWQ